MEASLTKLDCSSLYKTVTKWVFHHIGCFWNPRPTTNLKDILKLQDLKEKEKFPNCHLPLPSLTTYNIFWVRFDNDILSIMVLCKFTTFKHYNASAMITLKALMFTFLAPRNCPVWLWIMTTILAIVAQFRQLSSTFTLTLRWAGGFQLTAKGLWHSALQWFTFCPSLVEIKVEEKAYIACITWIGCLIDWLYYWWERQCLTNSKTWPELSMLTTFAA